MPPLYTPKYRDINFLPLPAPELFVHRHRLLGLALKRFLDIHRITETHQHIGMIYWARPRNGTLTLSPSEHHDIRWCSAAELDHLRPPMAEAVKWYCRSALTEIEG